jgi:hypothetical protein
MKTSNNQKSKDDQLIAVAICVFLLTSIETTNDRFPLVQSSKWKIIRMISVSGTSTIDKITELKIDAH